MTETSHTPAAAVARARQVFALRDLGVAPENIRFDEAADDEIPLLAATILAAGIMQPLTVRPGRRKEKPAMALDGRRRLLALALLAEQGAIDDGYPVEAFVETDPARQAAAVVLTNTAVPVHVADVIAAIGKMLKARLEVPAIAAALGYGEIEVRRLAALAGLSPDALQALKAGRMTLRQAKLLARLPDPEAQAQVMESVSAGYGFPEHRVSQAFERGQVTRSDRRFPLVGEVRYAAADGRIARDLFGEFPDVLLDPDLLDGLWIARAKDLAGRLERDDLIVHATSEPDPDWPEGLDPFGYDDEVQLDEAERAALQAAEAEERGAGGALDALDGAADTEAADAALVAYLAARLAAEQALEPRRPVTLVLLYPSRGRPIALQAFAPPAAPAETEAAPGGEGPDAARGGAASGESVQSEPTTLAAHDPAPPAPGPEAEGARHALHEVRTDLATRVLIRAVADHPPTALTALIAQLFSVEVLHQRGRGEGASTVTAEAYGRPRARVIESLDGEVRRRLAERRAAWRESGRSVIAWVSGLPAEDRMALLAELVAMSLDLCEARTGQVRRRARAEAGELAALCGAEPAAHWTPDEAFLRAHAKAQLLGMLAAMEEPDDLARTLKKEGLVTLVAEAAARRRWAPAYLAWRGEAVDATAEGEAEAKAAIPPPEGDGSAPAIAA